MIIIESSVAMKKLLVIYLLFSLQGAFAALSVEESESKLTFLKDKAKNLIDSFKKTDTIVDPADIFSILEQIKSLSQKENKIELFTKISTALEKGDLLGLSYLLSEEELITVLKKLDKDAFIVFFKQLSKEDFKNFFILYFSQALAMLEAFDLEYCSMMVKYLSFNLIEEGPAILESLSESKVKKLSAVLTPEKLKAFTENMSGLEMQNFSSRSENATLRAQNVGIFIASLKPEIAKELLKTLSYKQVADLLAELAPCQNNYQINSLIDILIPKETDTEKEESYTKYFDSFYSIKQAATFSLKATLKYLQ